MNAKVVGMLLLMNWSAVGFSEVGAQEVGAQKGTKTGDESESQLVETFAPPRVTQKQIARYPRPQQRRGQEGWVRLNYMVDPEGIPYEVTVVSSSSEAAFAKEAIRAVEETVYEPANLNGRPIDAGLSLFVTFQLEGGEPGATPSFVGRYKRFFRYVKQGRLDKAEKLLVDLRNSDRNLYEEAYLHLAEFNYKQNTGASASQLYESVKKAAAMDGDRGYLPDDALTLVLQNKLTLELLLQELGYAKRTATSLTTRTLTEKDRARVEAALSQIEQIRVAETSFGTDGVVPEGNLGFHVLIHNRFHLLDVQGDIAELRLHCDRGYVGFIPKPEMEYKIKSGLGNCHLTLIGTPGSTYTLVQG